jgi:hypothetical protein
MFICQESGRHVYFSRDWQPCLFAKRVAAMFICQESGRHVYLSREWPTCLFVKRMADMFICQESGRHAYFFRIVTLAVRSKSSYENHQIFIFKIYGKERQIKWI